LEEFGGSPFDRLLTKIQRRAARVAVLGQGYIGLPISLLLARSGFEVVGYDVNERLVEGLENLYTPNLKIKVSASIGSAIYGMDGTTPDDLLNTADMRMYEMKTSKKGGRR